MENESGAAGGIMEALVMENTSKKAMDGNGLKGTVVFPDGKKYEWTGVRAPSLKRDREPVWGKPIRLFSGTDLKGWHAMGENQWKAENGILRSPKSGANLVTDERFQDFKLHIEFRYPKGSNSGVYLRGRYEVQVMDGNNPPALTGRTGRRVWIYFSERTGGKEGGRMADL